MLTTPIVVDEHKVQNVDFTAAEADYVLYSDAAHVASGWVATTGLIPKLSNNVIIFIADFYKLKQY